MYEGLHAPIPSLEGYLEAIGYDGPREPSIAVLDDVLKHALLAIPFANTRVYEEHLEPSLDVADEYQKIVVDRKGGYCFELNGLLQAALEAMGFECQAVGCRVLFDNQLLRHRAMIVDVEGTRRFLDAGLAGPIPTRSILLEEGLVQHTGNGDFAFERDGLDWVLVKQGEKALRTVAFEDRPFRLDDFVTLNVYSARSDDSKMVEMYIYSRFTEDGFISIFGDEFTRKSGDVTERCKVTPEERRQLVHDEFGISL